MPRRPAGALCATVTVPKQHSDGELPPARRAARGRWRHAGTLQPPLEPAPSGKTYEIWVVPGGDIEQASPAGLFPGGEARDVLPVDGTMQTGDVVAVTVEREGGVDAPTRQPVVASDSL